MCKEKHDNQLVTSSRQRNYCFESTTGFKPTNFQTLDRHSTHLPTNSPHGQWGIILQDYMS